MRIDLVALDADDTLWHNEPLFSSVREQFCALLGRYRLDGVPGDRLDEVEMGNLRHFGYGVKGFVLSMIETAIEMTGGRLEASDVRTIIGWGRDMLESPVELLDGVPDAVEEIARTFRLILLTKGDLLHQETKLARSGLPASTSGSSFLRTPAPTAASCPGTAWTRRSSPWSGTRSALTSCRCSRLAARPSTCPTR
jgi:putative hydrolase of the HAD superfamily